MAGLHARPGLPSRLLTADESREQHDRMCQDLAEDARKIRELRDLIDNVLAGIARSKGCGGT